jgi:tetratricopeptide (TPR) repeat protein
LKILVPFLILLIISGNYNSGKASNKSNISINSIRDSVNSCYYSFDTARLENVLSLSKKLLKSKPGEFLPKYYRGILALNYGKVIYNSRPDDAYEYFTEAADLFAECEEMLDTADAEIYALLSAAYGKKSSLSAIKAIFWGIKAKNYIEKAWEADSNSNKVRLVAATHLMHVPPFYGGDKKRAGEMLKDCFGNDNDLIHGRINWAGDAEIYAYLAQLKILQSDTAAARKHMDKALELAPGYGFVEIDLEKQIGKLSQ